MSSSCHVLAASGAQDLPCISDLATPDRPHPTTGTRHSDRTFFTGSVAHRDTPPVTRIVATRRPRHFSDTSPRLRPRFAQPVSGNSGAETHSRRSEIGLKVEGINLPLADGEAAGQEVFHVHLRSGRHGSTRLRDGKVADVVSLTRAGKLRCSIIIAIPYTTSGRRTTPDG